MILVVSILVGGIIAYLVVQFFFGFFSAMKKPSHPQNKRGTSGSQKAAGTYGVQGVGQPPSANTWWNNRQRSPLSDAEARQVAEKVAQFYDSWQANHAVNHSWLCIALNADKAECRQIYNSLNQGFAPTPTFAYPHRLSCQADREHLAQHILARILRDHPYCRLYLDGDSLILPTNAN